MLGTPAAAKGYRASSSVERKVQRPAIKPNAVFSVGCLARSGWRLTKVPCRRRPSHHLVCGGGIVPSCGAHAQGLLVVTEHAVQILLALAACSRAGSRFRPCDVGKRCEDSMQLGARTFVGIHFEHAYAHFCFAVGKKLRAGRRCANWKRCSARRHGACAHHHWHSVARAQSSSLTAAS
jgi:hypothetical protein